MTPKKSRKAHLFTLHDLRKSRRRKKFPVFRILFVLIIGYGLYSLISWGPHSSKPFKSTPKLPATSTVTTPVKVTPPKPSKPTPPKVVEEKPTIIYPPQHVSVTQRKLKPWTSKPKIVFVIDDIGHNLTNESLLRSLGNQVTYAILPFLKYSAHFGKLSEQTGAEVILHLPLETVDGTIPGPGLITQQMSHSYVLEQLRNDLGTIPNHVGANNHMGSSGTADPKLMKTILGELKKQNLFFLDSFTSPNSVARDVGRNLRLPVLKRDVFLDNVDNQDAIRKQLRELAKIAIRQGVGIGIGHDRYNTLTVIKEEIPRLKQSGFDIVSLSDVVAHETN